MKTASLAGVWTVSADDGVIHNLKIPGTLDESNIGHRDKKNPEKGLTEKLGPAASGLDRVFTDDDLVFADAVPPDPDENIYSRFTRKYTYEGAVRIYRMLSCRENPGKRLFLDVERARVLSLMIDGEEVMPYRIGTLLSGQSFEVTGKLQGSHMLSFMSDNSYPGLPREQILASNMASDDTQTNWNGLLGYVRLRQEEACFIENVNVYPSDGKLSVYVEISCAEPGKYEIGFSSPALQKEYRHRIGITESFFSFTAEGLLLREDLKKWDENEGNLYELTVSLNGEKTTVPFGIREFRADDTHFRLNGRKIFLRGQTDCSIYPETSYAPMDPAAWKKKLSALRDYGVNFVHFRSCCPPEQAFQAADELGMFLMPELSLSGDQDAFSGEQARQYYRSELLAILRSYGNHPSFVMLSLGNRLRFSEESLDYACELLEFAKKIDPMRLYTVSSDEPLTEKGLALSEEQEEKYLAASDFLMTPSWGTLLFRGTDHPLRAESGLRGFVNNEYPGTERGFDEEILLLRESVKKPLLSASAGGYSILPDFREISFFSGFLEPKNLTKMRDDAESEGLLSSWDRYVSASGEQALLSYRMEIEQALRSKLLAGITLFSLQDYPGKESALVGMMNTHLLPKPYPFSAPQRFKSFFGAAVPLLRTERFCYEAGEELNFSVSVANYTAEEISTPVSYTLRSDQVLSRGQFEETVCPPGTVTDFAEKITLPLLPEDAKEPQRFTLIIRLNRTELEYPVFVYPRVLPLCPMEIYETDTLNQTALLMLREGGKVLLTPQPNAEVLPQSVHSEFSTDFVSSRLYPKQSGTMGRIADLAHPVLRRFLSEEWGGLQWWQLSLGRAVVLPRRMKSIVSVMDSIHTLRPLSEMIEFRCLEGTVFLCPMGLKNHMDRPEVRFLVSEIYHYMESYDFSPSQELKLSELQAMIKP